MLRLFTTAYPEPDPARRAEYAECLARNLALAVIDEVLVFAEGGVESGLPGDSKLKVRVVSCRPTYDDFFAWINEVAGPDDLSIVANSDIFFDDSICLLDSILHKDICLALSRWDIIHHDRFRLWERGDSQDVWAFKGQIKGLVLGDFPLGVYFCDNKIAWQLREAGYKVINPAFSMRCYHLHRGETRSYDPENPPDHGIRPPFLYVEPDNSGSLPVCLRLWIKHRPGYFPWRFTWRKLGRTTPGRITMRVWNRLCRLFRI